MVGVIISVLLNSQCVGRRIGGGKKNDRNNQRLDNNEQINLFLWMREKFNSIDININILPLNTIASHTNRNWSLSLVNKIKRQHFIPSRKCAHKNDAIECKKKKTNYFSTLTINQSFSMKFFFRSLFVLNLKYARAECLNHVRCIWFIQKKN